MSNSSKRQFVSDKSWTRYKTHNRVRDKYILQLDCKIYNYNLNTTSGVGTRILFGLSWYAHRGQLL